MQPENIHPNQVDNSNDIGVLVGKSLGQFRVVERIGSGDMAMVFKAYKPMFDRYVAIKVFPAHYACDPVFIKRFEREARLVARLAHPNIVQIHDFGEQDNITYIVMEYVDGGTLKDRLKCALPVAEAVDFIIQAAEGLEYAHRNGIVHRDVKPANMLVRKDGHLLLSDFGIAKIFEGMTNPPWVGTGIGTPQYMSPEQGTGQMVDRRTDIYSLGIVLFHCLTDRVPFAADSPLAITLKHLNEPLPVDKLVAEAVPAPIIQVVQKMAAKQQQDRYQTAEEVVEVLTKALVASNLSLPRGYRGELSSFSPVVPLSGSSSLGQVSSGDPTTSNPQLSQNEQAAMWLTCFCCGTANLSTRLFCTNCGDELYRGYTMDNSVLQQLLTTKDFTEKSAIAAEYFFCDLSEETSRVARQCTLFHWFDVPIIEALLQETSLTEDEKSEACKQFVSLPFIETLPWGYRFQNLTREGLLKRYVLTQPELLQKAAHLAAPAYKAREDDKRMAAEAFFCYMIAGNQPLSIYLLDKLQEEASSQEDWYSLSNLLQLQDEAEQLPFVQPLPRTEQHWLLRGLVHRAQGKLEIAIADCSNATLINTESALAYISRGTLYAEQQHNEQALTDYNLALRFDPMMTQAYINRGIVYKNQKRFSEALQDFNSALQLDPNNVFVYCNKGSILNELGQYEEALAAYEQALRIDPDSNEAYYGKEQVLHDTSLQEGEKTKTQTQESPTDSRQSEGMYHYLKVPATLDGPPERIALGSDKVSIGRAVDNELVFDDPNTDRYHAEVRMIGQRCCITDLGSVHGTFINGQQILPKVGYILHQGDMICIGTISLVYMVSGTNPIILVDGYNVIKKNFMFQQLEIKNLALARDTLIRQLKNRYRQTSYQVIVVFDGNDMQEQVAHDEHIRIIFSRHDQTADSVIIRLAVESRKAGREVILYSDDEEVKQNVVQQGGAFLTTRQLIAQLNAAPSDVAMRSLHRRMMRRVYGVEPSHKPDDDLKPSPQARKKKKKSSRRYR